jgi:hypothetical protein
MMYMGEQEHSHRQEDNTPPATAENNRRRTERRIHESKGYAYISMVGWMDRREKKRRQDDDYDTW